MSHDNKVDKCVEKEFQDFWVPLIFDLPNGRLNLKQLKKELYDYSMLMERVSKVYMEITGGRISKPNTDAGDVIAEFNDYVNELVWESTKGT